MAKNEYAEYESISKDKYERLINAFNDMKITKKEMKKIIKRYIQIKRIDTKKVNFTFYVIPEGAQRPRCLFKQKRFYVPNAKKFRDVFKNYIKENGLEEVIYTPCKMTAKYYFPIPKSMNREEKILSEMKAIKNSCKPDWDNLGKTTDMFNKKLWIDDSLVVESHVYKFYSFKPRIEIEVEYLLDFDCKYTKRNKTASKVFKEMYEKGFIKNYGGMD